MNELYWITRLDGICGFLTLISVFSVIATVVLFFTGLIKRRDSDIYNEDSETCERNIETSKMCLYLAKREKRSNFAAQKQRSHELRRYAKRPPQEIFAITIGK